MVSARPVMQMKLDGMKELFTSLERMDKAISKKVIRKALKPVGNMLRAAARVSAPKMSGRGARSLGYSIKKIKGDPLGYEAVVGIQKGTRSMTRYKAKLALRKKIKGSGSYSNKQKELRATMTPTWMRYQEFGWNQKIGKGRKGSRFIPARPWLRPSFDANKQQAVNVFCTEAKKHLAEATAAANSGVMQ